MTRTLTLALAAFPLSTLLACESVSSDDVKTSGMWAGFNIQAEGDGKTRATATLKVGGETSNTFVQLSADDVLSVIAGGASLEMSEQNLGDIYTYTADFDFDEEGTAFVFDLERATEDSAPDSEAVLPEPLDLTEPAEDSIFSRADDDLAVAWTPFDAGDDMELVVSGDCIIDVHRELDGDIGRVTIEAGELLSFESEEDDSCDAEVQIWRKRTGSLDPAFGEGQVYGAQVRKVTVRLDP